MDDVPGAVKISLDQALNMRAPGTYLVRVEGDSMQGAGIFSGDILVIDRAREPVRGNIIIAVINSEPMCKRLDYCGSTPVLRSDNSKYPPRYIMEGDEFSSWGVVVSSLRDHNKTPSG
jgi:DNA polymerase V